MRRILTEKNYFLEKIRLFSKSTKLRMRPSEIRPAIHARNLSSLPLNAINANFALSRSAFHFLHHARANPRTSDECAPLAPARALQSSAEPLPSCGRAPRFLPCVPSNRAPSVRCERKRFKAVPIRSRIPQKKRRNLIEIQEFFKDAAKSLIPTLQAKAASNIRRKFFPNRFQRISKRTFASAFPWRAAPRLVAAIETMRPERKTGGGPHRGSNRTIAQFSEN